MNELAAPCPLCREPIPVSARDWTCPCCRHANKAIEIFETCENCGFGPYYMECPSCGGEFEMMLLMGDYKTSWGGTAAPERRPALTPGNIYRLDTLRIQAFQQVRELLDFVEILETKRALFDECTFRFPCELTAWAVHTVRKGLDSTAWIHAFLLTKGSGDDSVRVGQIAVQMKLSGSDSGTRVALVEAFPESRGFMATLPQSSTGVSGQNTIRVRLSEVEPFSAPDIPVEAAMGILRHFGTQEFRCHKRPQALFIYSISNNLPAYSCANGWLLDCSVDTAMNLESEQAFKRHTIGHALLECGGDLGAATIQVR